MVRLHRKEKAPDCQNRRIFLFFWRQETPQNRGIVLSAVLILSIIFGLAAYADLMLAMNVSKKRKFWKERMNARYAAEAGVVYAKQIIWIDKRWASPEGVDFYLNGFGVDVVVPACTQTPCESREISASVVYNK